MKCINKKIFLLLLCMVSLVFSSCGSTSFVNKNNTAYDMENAVVKSGNSYITRIGDINFMNENVDTSHSGAAALYSLNDGSIRYSKNINAKLYPASTTKILTAYVALKYGNLSDHVKISNNCMLLEAGATVCGFKPGDYPTLEQVLYGFLTCSGNDAGIAIAEHISGSVEDFAVLMNEEAKKLGAVNSHFVNPHGLHNDDHYTTLNDLYLIFKAALSLDRFRDFISQAEYSVSFYNEAGTQMRQLNWITTNYYRKGMAEPPKTVKVIGSKTGTTDEAGSCLVQLSSDNYGNEYISIIMKSDTHQTLYKDMASLLNTLIKK